MKLFISYARVDKPFCEQIVRTLETAHFVWHDRRLHAGKKWWDQILHRLEWCEGFVYLLSPESIDSEYCQKEYDIARDMGKQIFPIKIQSNTSIPKELLEIQIIDLSEGITSETVALLMAGVNVAEVEYIHRNVEPSKKRTTKSPTIQSSDGSKVFASALEAYSNGRLDSALFQLLQVKEIGDDTGKFINLDQIINNVRAALDRQTYLREAERCYMPIRQMMRVPAMKDRGCEAFERFRREFPDYDPDNNISNKYIRHVRKIRRKLICEKIHLRLSAIRWLKKRGVISISISIAVIIIILTILGLENSSPLEDSWMSRIFIDFPKIIASYKSTDHPFITQAPTYTHFPTLANFPTYTPYPTYTAQPSSPTIDYSISSIDEIDFYNTVWKQSCPGLNSAEYWIKFRDDNLFGYTDKPELPETFYFLDDTWKIENGNLVINWSRGTVLIHFNLDTVHTKILYGEESFSSTECELSTNYAITP